MIYLDANATEPLRPEARQAALAAMDVPGNPSSPHKAGRQARALLDDARRRVSARLGVHPDNCVFTSGGTEANTLAVRALGTGRHILISATEHDAVRKAPADGHSVTFLPVLPSGVIDLAVLEERLADTEAAKLVCVMLANNETGVINPIGEVATLCHAAGAWLHVDAVQGVGRLPVDLPSLGADSLALSGHKFGGMKGAGALVLAGDAPVVLHPLQAGGGQERGRRGGTQALPAIAALAAALDAALDHPSDLTGLRDRINTAAIRCGTTVGGDDAHRLANTSCLILPGVKSQAQLIALDLEGFCVSAGAACSSGKVGGSHVLEAMGLGDLAGNAIRVSLPWNVEAEHVERFIAAYERMAARRRAE
ncbi:cysteine desulfurase family protein [Acetobacter conturbans]|uniref:Cysteine desulfurase n=1 Tax=Acetobacter conturbans TaxID=1737472 RepID=A0ABX0K319_9PROT|nr:cysteine desulfurase family protein [Acetobacter conturbans]NHN89655.1 aminotransferase class V-fold PLP-dependent enzyme [Acetobacter conturbans]